MSLAILGIGTAVPPWQIKQADAAGLAAGFANAPPGRQRALEAVYRQTRIETRGSVLLESPGPHAYRQSFCPPSSAAGDAGPSTAERNARYCAEAGPLALAAARSALATAKVVPAAITHLITCSCTGFANPGVDLELLHGLGLNANVARTHVGFMGCHGAFNSLRVAAAFASAQPEAVVLVVCVELCSLHFQYGPQTDRVVANSIFADGAGALVGAGAAHPRASDAGVWHLAQSLSQVLPDSHDQMSWGIGDHGFEMTLSPQVPATIALGIGELVAAGLGPLGKTPADVGSWAVQPGGPRVLSSVEEALGLNSEALIASRGVLSQHGNMSSATILFILERLLREETVAPCVALAFGPGLTAELAVFDLKA